MIVETAKPRSCFLHVPKSGGTALTLYLQSVLGSRQVFHIGEGRYRKMPLEGLMKRYPVITGHFNLGQIPDRLFETTFFFTFLREPVDRIVSMFHFFKEGDVDSDRRVLINEEWSLEKALDKWVRPGSCSSWSNEQTFLFSGTSDAGQPPEALLPLAMRNLERFDFVGLHERFADGVECLGRLRGWPLNAPVPRFKTSRRRLAVADVEPAMVERIIAANACDIQLFARARELWEETRARAAGARRVAASLPAQVNGRCLLTKEADGQSARSPDDTSRDVTTVDSPVGCLLPRVEKGSLEISFSSIDAFDLRTGGDAVIQRGNPVEIRLAVYSTLDTDDINIGLSLTDEVDMEVYGTDTQLRGCPLTLAAGTITRVNFVFGMSLAPGAYFLSVAIRGGDKHDQHVFHSVDNAMLLWCVDESAPAFTGLVDLRAKMELIAVKIVEKRPWRPPKLVRYLLRVIREKPRQAYRRAYQIGHNGYLHAYQLGYNGYLRAYQMGYNGYLRAYQSGHDGYLRAYQLGHNGLLHGRQFGHRSYLRGRQIAHDLRHRGVIVTRASRRRSKAFLHACRSAANELSTRSRRGWHRTTAFLHASWHRSKARLPYLRPPKLVRYVLRTIKNERWGAIKYFLGGKPPPKRENRP